MTSSTFYTSIHQDCEEQGISPSTGPLNRLKASYAYLTQKVSISRPRRACTQDVGGPIPSKIQRGRNRLRSLSMMRMFHQCYSRLTRTVFIR